MHNEAFLAPGKRLLAIADLCKVRCQKKTTDTFLYAVDVGTDHAKLPIYLLQNKICSKVVATDINKGPLERAERNICMHLSKEQQKSISLIHTDGLCSLDASGVDTVIISGMGGELIIKIIKSAPEGFFKNPEIWFILQPQKNIDLVRSFLYSSGYCIKNECLVKEQGRIYPVILAHYDAKVRKRSLIELHLGEHIIKENSELFSEYFAKQYANVKKSYMGKAASGQLTEYEEELYKSFNDFKIKEGL